MAKAIFDFLIFSQVFVALTSIFMLYGVTTILGIRFSIEMALITFSTVFLVYTTNRSFEAANDVHSSFHRVAFIRSKRRFLMPTAIVLYSVSMILAFLKTVLGGTLLLIPVLVSILYTMHWIPRVGKRTLGFSRIKSILIVKNAVISLLWAGLITFFPILYSKSVIGLLAIALFFFIFIRILINTITFDFKDILSDKLSRTMTLPLKIGTENTKNILYALNIISFVYWIMLVLLDIVSLNKILIAIVSLTGLIYVYRIPRHSKIIRLRHTYFYDIIVDGNESILLGILAYISTLRLI